jgi:exodeoxyribonuclease VII large subunit
MKGIDPTFTLGQMAVNRERILRNLAQAGLLEENAARDLPPVPQRIGLVTSLGSAAYNDFVHEIEASGLGLRLLACDARVQGAQTEATVVRALRALQRSGCDLIVLIRGGGSRSDLAGFDSESIARAIANCAVPVWTGIGHEIDRSVADEVAHTAFKTPTAVAAAIVERTEEYLDAMEANWQAIQGAAHEALLRQEQHLLLTTRTTAREARRSFDRRTLGLGRRSRELVHAVRLRLVEAEGRLSTRAEALAPERFARALHRRHVQLSTASSRLAHSAHRAVRDARRQLDSLQARVQANDPERLLARGYSLSYDEGGALLRDPAGLRAGAPLRTRLARGEVLSRVESTSSPENPRKAGGREG